jgi:hypothetical protein
MITNYDVSAAGMVAILIQIVIPLVVSVITKTSGHVRVKAIAVIVLSGVTELLTIYASSDTFDWKHYLLNTLVGIVISVVSYVGFWKPTGASGVADNLGPQ